MTTPVHGTVTTFTTDDEPPPKRPSRLYPHLGATIDARYKVERALGEGGMGVVYIARDLKFSTKRVALKVLKAELADDEPVVRRFFDEAEAASRIGSPHIVQVFDFGTIAGEGAPYIVMELLEGKSLANVLDKLRILPAARVVSIAKQMATGLAAAHEKGIVHRDLKPDNVQLLATPSAADYVKILDFGIAKLGNRNTRLTQVGAVFGTPQYMAPEQCAGLAVDGRADVYGLGVMMFEMLAGRVPFDGGPHAAILSHHLYSPPPRLRDVAPDGVSPAMEAIVAKCLSKKADARYATMSELARDLERLEGGLAPIAEGEMKARPTAYDRPADYFAKDTRIVRAKERSPLVGIAVGAAIATVLVVLGATVVAARNEPAVSKKPSGITMVSSAPLAPPALVHEAARAIAIAVSPADAEVRGPGGEVLVARAGIVRYEPKSTNDTLVFARAGFVSRSVEVGSGSPAVVRVDLVPMPLRPTPGRAPAAPPVAAAPTKPAALGRSDCFVDGKLAPFPECRAFDTP